tara:strand:- start:324 stop:548 length:225 start_codon:yes stop_codon:yes gene_type:complete
MKALTITAVFLSALACISVLIVATEPVQGASDDYGMYPKCYAGVEYIYVKHRRWGDAGLGLSVAYNRDGSVRQC